MHLKSDGTIYTVWSMPLSEESSFRYIFSLVIKERRLVFGIASYSRIVPGTLR